MHNFIYIKRKKTNMKKILLLSFVMGLPTVISANPLSLFYASVFGNENASGSYQKMIQHAFEDYGYPFDSSVPIKKMNSLASKLVGAQLYSFTMFGFWLNEELLDDADESIRAWIIYHEVAHYILGHHAKALGLAAIMIPLIAMTNSFAQYRYGKLPGLAIAGSFAYGLHSYALKPYIKQQEKEADLAVLRLLWRIDKVHPIISHYLDFLQKNVESNGGDQTDGWHYTLAEQYEYLNGTYLTLMAEFRFQ